MESVAGYPAIRELQRILTYMHLHHHPENKKRAAASCPFLYGLYFYAAFKAQARFAG